MSARLVGFPKELMAGQDGSLSTVMGLPVGKMESRAGAFEVARRWNAFEELTSALSDLVAATKNGAVGTLDPVWTGARAALKNAGAL